MPPPPVFFLKIKTDLYKMLKIKCYLSQLSLLPEVVRAMGYDTSRFDIADLLDFFQSLGNARKLLLSEICTHGKLMPVMPATNAVSERSFSALKRVKTYLRSTTGEGRLNHLMLLHACPQGIGRWY